MFGAQTSVQVDADGGILSSFADLSSRAAEAPSEATVDAAEARTAALALTARETGAPRSALTASDPAPRIPLACNPPYSRAEGAPPHPQVEVNRAYTFLGQSYQYFFSQFGRDSIDGAGMVLEAKVRHCQPGAACPYPNAFWSGAQDQVTFGTLAGMRP